MNNIKKIIARAKRRKLKEVKISSKRSLKSNKRRSSKRTNKRSLRARRIKSDRRPWEIPEDTENSIIRAFENNLGTDSEYIGKTPHSEGYVFKLGNTEYLVFDSIKQAQEEASYDVDEMVRADPYEYVDDKWMSKYMYMEKHIKNEGAEAEAESWMLNDKEDPQKWQEDWTEEDWEKMFMEKYDEVYDALTENPFKWLDEQGAMSMEEWIEKGVLNVDAKGAYDLVKTYSNLIKFLKSGQKQTIKDPENNVSFVVFEKL